MSACRVFVTDGEDHFLIHFFQEQFAIITVKSMSLTNQIVECFFIVIISCLPMFGIVAWIELRTGTE